LGIVEGAALCVVTDHNRVVYAWIDEVITGVVEGGATPPIRGSALLWVPPDRQGCCGDQTTAVSRASG